MTQATGNGQEGRGESADNEEACGYMLHDSLLFLLRGKTML
jgi:hypothetical protein